MDSIVAFLRVRSEDLQTSFYFIWSLLLSLEKKKKGRVVGKSQGHNALKLTLICACDGNQIYITQNTEPFFSFQNRSLYTLHCAFHTGL